MTALGGAFMNQYFQRQGQSYDAATASAQAVVLIGGIALLESFVELQASHTITIPVASATMLCSALQGCGVPLGNITPGALLVFFPFLIGRIVAGVFVQARKTGEEFSSVSRPDAPNRYTYDAAPSQRCIGECRYRCCPTSGGATTRPAGSGRRGATPPPMRMLGA